MRRIILLLAVALVMVAITAGTAFANHTHVGHGAFGQCVADQAQAGVTPPLLPKCKLDVITPE